VTRSVITVEEIFRVTPALAKPELVETLENFSSSSLLTLLWKAMSW
jgi:hypothetical protein